MTSPPLPPKSGWTRVAFLATALLACALVGLMIRSTNEQTEAGAWVRHTRDVQDEMSLLMVSMANIDSRMRSYVISERESWLPAYREEIAISDRQIQKIGKLITDNPVEQLRLGELKKALDAHVQWTDEMIQMAKTKGFPSAVRELASGRGESDQEGLMGRIGEMYAAEETLLGARQAESNRLKALSRTNQEIVGALLVLQVVIEYLLFRSRLKSIRKEQMTALASLAYAEGIVATVREPLLVVDSDLRVRSANRSFYLQFKTEPRQVEGRLLGDMSRGEWMIPELFERLRGVFADGGEFVGFSFKLPQEGGGQRTLVVNARKLYRPGNHTGLALISIQDETHLLQVEEQIREVNGELEGFAYSVAHDLRAPLRAMQGFSQALSEDFAAQLGEIGRGYTTHIAQASHRMDRLIRDLLEYSRLSRSDLVLGTVSLAAVVESAQRQVQAELTAAKAEVSVEEPLPAVKGSSGTLVLSVANMLSNACKFVGAGVTPKIRVRAEARGNRYRLWIEDNGIGIASEHQERIFRVFERLHGQDSFPGTGIGLALVRKGMQRLGGSAGVESEPGKGARFWIELERASEVAAAA